MSNDKPVWPPPGARPPTVEQAPSSGPAVTPQVAVGPPPPPPAPQFPPVAIGPVPAADQAGLAQALVQQGQKAPHEAQAIVAGLAAIMMQSVQFGVAGLAPDGTVLVQATYAIPPYVFRGAKGGTLLGPGGQPLSVQKLLEAVFHPPTGRLLVHQAALTQEALKALGGP